MVYLLFSSFHNIQALPPLPRQTTPQSVFELIRLRQRFFKRYLPCYIVSLLHHIQLEVITVPIFKYSEFARIDEE
jgi:hypothetical protein